VWSQWMRQPQTHWLRRALFQLHLWSGLAIGLYLVMLSLTGSVLVYRIELGRMLGAPRPVFDPNATRLTTDEMRQAVALAYPGWTITEMGERITRREPAVSVFLERGTEQKKRLFNPYTGADLGEFFTRGEAWLQWVVNLHDELLFGHEGRFWNGIGSGIATALCLTGLVVWWPGKSRWKRSLQIKRRTGWRRFNWDLHSAMGFWLFLFLVMWGISGFYMGIPEPFTNFVNYVSDPNAPGERPGDIVLNWLTRLHFGRWRGQPWLKALWAIIGLAPALMAATGAIMWWNRVVRRRGMDTP
jgi:uncharacterized iron-regulated membrane protein